MNIVIGKDTGSYIFDATGQTVTLYEMGDVTLKDVYLTVNETYEKK